MKTKKRDITLKNKNKKVPELKPDPINPTICIFTYQGFRVFFGDGLSTRVHVNTNS